MRYMFLLFTDETKAPPEPETAEAFEAMMAPWQAYDRALRDAGVFVGGEALEPSPTATTLRRSEGQPVVTDGPFAETKEQVAGYYIVDCASLEEALAWAKKCPVEDTDSIEVRPVMALPG